MALKQNGPGCGTPCGSCGGVACGRIDRTVRGCNALALPGATVVLRDAGLATVATATTNATGDVSFAALAAGTYSLLISKARFTTATVGGLTIDCTTSPVLSGSRTLTVAAGYHCMTLCPDPFPDTLYVTDSAGTHTLTWDAAFSFWHGQTTATATPTVSCVPVPTCTVNAPGGGGSVPVYINVDRDFANHFELSYGADATPNPSNAYTLASCNGCSAVAFLIGPAAVASTITCGTIAFSGTVGSTWSRTGPTISLTGPVTGTATVSE